jgi:hypothetical protein
MPALAIQGQDPQRASVTHGLTGEHPFGMVQA